MSGDIDPRRTNTNARAPDSWNDAFAALPMEAPQSGWDRLSVALDGEVIAVSPGSRGLRR